jgi:hypothetical protein
MKINIPNNARIVNFNIDRQDAYQSEYGRVVFEELDPILRDFCVYMSNDENALLVLCVRDKSGVMWEWDTNLPPVARSTKKNIAEGVKYIKSIFEEEFVEIDF